MNFKQTIAIIFLFLITIIIVIGGTAFITYSLINQPVEKEVIQVPVQQEIPVDYIVAEVVQKVMLAMPTPQPIVIQQQIIPTPDIPTQSIPTPVPAIEEPEEKCNDAATLVINTPYFKTFKNVVASITVYNIGTCLWQEGSHYIAYVSAKPFLIPEVVPGSWIDLQVPIEVKPGLTAIVPVVMGEFGEPLTPQAQMDTPSALTQFDYAQPQESVPYGTIIINWPTKDWEGLQYPVWKPVPGLNGWWYLEGGNGDGYHFGNCPPGG